MTRPCRLFFMTRKYTIRKLLILYEYQIQDMLDSIP